MKFTIPCRIYTRLVEGALPIGQLAIEGASRPGLSSILLERSKGKDFAISCNSAVLSCEYLGVSDQSDEGQAAITIDPLLVTMALAAPDALIKVTTAPDWTFIDIEGVMMYPGNGAVEFAPEWNKWRGLVPSELPKKPLGALSFPSLSLIQLAKCSPSGWLVLPKCYDASVPVLVRDCIDPDWFGLFLPLTEKKLGKPPMPAEIPEWIKE